MRTACILLFTLFYTLAPLSANIRPLNIHIAKKEGAQRIPLLKGHTPAKKTWDRGNRAMLKKDQRRSQAPLKKTTLKGSKNHRKLTTRGGDWRKPIVKRKLKTISPEQAAQSGFIESPVTRTFNVKKYRSPKRQHGFSPRRKSTPSMQSINKYVYRGSHSVNPGMPVQYLPPSK